MLTTARECRLHAPCVPTTFKQRLTCRTQHHPTLSAIEISRAAAIPHHLLLRYGQETSNRHIPFEVLLRVVRVTGAVDLLAVAIDEALGLQVTPRPSLVAEAERLHQEVLDVADAAGELAGQARAAAQDGYLDRAERERLLEAVRRGQKELGDVIAALGVNIARPTPAKAALPSHVRRGSTAVAAG